MDRKNSTQTEYIAITATDNRPETLFIKQWVRVCLFSLLIVAFLGSLMRYKIAYSLPFLPQKNVLNAHSHFAFAGWVTQILMVLLVDWLIRQGRTINVKKYGLLLWANILTAYGMLFSFPWEGYGIISIIFSTLSIFVSYAFAVVYWRDLNTQDEATATHYWFKAAVLFNALSSLGAFSLAYMMAARIHHEHWYLGAIYFFLHFQYNGWFFFACAGLLYGLNRREKGNDRLVFWLFALSCGPAYLLSVLWAKLPAGAFFITAIASVMQLAGWGLLLLQARKGQIRLLNNAMGQTRLLLLFAAIAGSIKFLLQTGSLSPELAKLAFGFRPIVIGYLHLVLLAFISLFIITYLLHLRLVTVRRIFFSGLAIFIGGIIIQEALLLLQGMTGIVYISVPGINEVLLLTAIALFAGILLMNIGARKQA